MIRNETESTVSCRPCHESNISHFSTAMPHCTSIITECVQKSKFQTAQKILPSNCSHRKKTTREEFQLFGVLECILRSRVCDDEHCLIFKGSQLSAILFDEPVLQNAFLRVELENEIIRLTHQSFSVPTSMKRYFLDRFVSR